jgi:cytidylate kinase
VPRVQAEEIVESTDRNQNLFSNYFFKADFSDPKLYHAVINIDRTSPDEICDIVPLMLGEMKTPSLQSD